MHGWVVCPCTVGTPHQERLNEPPAAFDKWAFLCPAHPEPVEGRDVHPLLVRCMDSTSSPRTVMTSHPARLGGVPVHGRNASPGTVGTRRLPHSIDGRCFAPLILSLSKEELCTLLPVSCMDSTSSPCTVMTSHPARLGGVPVHGRNASPGTVGTRRLPHSINGRYFGPLILSLSKDEMYTLC